MLWVFVVCTIECSQLVPSLPFKCQSDPPQSPHPAVVHHHHCCCRCQKIIKSIFTGITCSCQGSEMSKYVLGFKADNCKRAAKCRCWGEVPAPRSHLLQRSRNLEANNFETSKPTTLNSKLLEISRLYMFQHRWGAVWRQVNIIAKNWKISCKAGII